MRHLICALLFFPLAGFSQSLTPEVVGTAGDHFTGSPGQLSWTVGEIAINSYFGTSNQLTQGFHQPENGLVTINEFSQQLSVNAYPNPFNTSIQIQIPANVAQVDVLIYDALGNIVHRDSYSGNQPKNIDLSSLASGIYHLHFVSPEGTLNNIKVQKL